MSLGLLGHLLKQESCSLWNYFSRLLIGLAVIFVFLKVQSLSSYGAKGAVFQAVHSQILFVIVTVSAIELYSGLLYESRKGGILGLLLMTGVPVKHFLGSTFFGKNYQLFSILIMQIPFCLFSVTLGGVSADQILVLYLCLFCWLFMVSAIYTYIGVMYSLKNEAIIINCLLTLSIFIGFSIFGLLPFSRVSEVLFGSKQLDYISVSEITYLLIGALVWFKNLNGFEKYVNTPKSFLNKNKNARRKKIMWKGTSPILIRILNKKLKLKIDNKSHPILQKDLFLYPKSSLLPFQAFPGDESVGLIILSSLTVFFSIFFIFLTGLLPYLFIISGIVMFFTFFRSWIRLINNFKYEFDDDTFRSLMILPLKNHLLLKYKMAGSRVYDKVFWGSYGLNVSALFLLILNGAHFHEEFILSIVSLPLFKSVAEKVTLVQLFRNRNSAVFTSSGVVLSLASLYFTFTIFAICFFAVFYFILHFQVMKAMEHYGSGI